jgi:hypothetical protein
MAEKKYRYYITGRPSSDTAEADSLDGAIEAARTLWRDMIEKAHDHGSDAWLPDGITIELKEIPEWDEAEPQTEVPWPHSTS